MNDNYSHTDGKIFYVCESIPSVSRADNPDSLRIISEFHTQLSAHCTCSDLCSVRNCRCILNEEENYMEINGELIATDGILLNDRPVIECNCLCPCNNTCRNRLVQFGPRNDLIVKSALENSKGVGLYTRNFIPKGSFVCEYAGEILSKTEAVERSSINKKNNLMNYIICVNEHIGANKIQTFIDPSEFGNIGRYMNHSCEPNCIMLPIRVNIPIPKLCLFAVKDIDSETELTFHYGSKTKEENLNQYSNLEQRIKCLCGSKNCQKWLPIENYD